MTDDWAREYVDDWFKGDIEAFKEHKKKYVDNSWLQPREIRKRFVDGYNERNTLDFQFRKLSELLIEDIIRSMSYNYNDVEHIMFTNETAYNDEVVRTIIEKIPYEKLPNIKSVYAVNGYNGSLNQEVTDKLMSKLLPSA